jgi:hypothetical protein
VILITYSSMINEHNLAGLLYSSVGNTTNPLWFVTPRELKISPDHKATSVLINANYICSGRFAVVFIG